MIKKLIRVILNNLRVWLVIKAREVQAKVCQVSAKMNSQTGNPWLKLLLVLV